MVVSELRGEKIDIIPFNEEPARFVAKALSPARVREVLVDDEAKQATVIVPDDQLSLAIGKDGLNARLAARLTGWRVDIRSETEFAEEEAEMGYQEEEVSGRCAAILANGKRCPNASLPGSRYCGLPAHQSLTDQPTDYLVPPEEGGNGAGGEPAEEGEVPEPVAEEGEEAVEQEIEADLASSEDIAPEAAEGEIEAEAAEGEIEAEAAEGAIEADVAEEEIEADVEIGEAFAEAEQGGTPAATEEES
jgi:N utilization substance protein A